MATYIFWRVGRCAAGTLAVAAGREKEFDRDKYPGGSRGEARSAADPRPDSTNGNMMNDSLSLGPTEEIAPDACSTFIVPPGRQINVIRIVSL